MEIKIRIDGKMYKTGLRKLGAILGDSCETGCNSVSNPGTLLGKASLVYPNVSVPAGFYPQRSVISMKTKKVISVRSYKK